MSKELLINRESEEELDIIRHDCAHVLAEAVQSLFPGTQVTIGPTIENGFYYDFAREKPFTSDDLIVIEKKMHEIILMNKKNILEGCTTNIICVKNNKLYLPKTKYYFGVTLQFIMRHTKRIIIKKNINVRDLDTFDEILLVGSGKGVIKLQSISQIKWNSKSDIVFNELQDLYNSYIA